MGLISAVKEFLGINDVDKLTPEEWSKLPPELLQKMNDAVNEEKERMFNLKPKGPEGQYGPSPERRG